VRTLPNEADLYSLQDESGVFTVIKVLKVEADGVHVRQYSNEFTDHPDHVDEDALFMAGMHQTPQQRIGLGHIPVSAATFSRWQPRFIQRGTVLPDELEGYEYWKEEPGGWF
jgi:hypothetical protein